jgi:hypothetical protein
LYLPALFILRIFYSKRPLLAALYDRAVSSPDNDKRATAIFALLTTVEVQPRLLMRIGREYTFG